MLGVTIGIIILSAFLGFLGLLTYDTVITCNGGQILPQSAIGDGETDCYPFGEDENGGFRVSEEASDLSYVFFGLSLVVMIAGFCGLITKTLADGISAGLFLHEHRIVRWSDSTQNQVNMGVDSGILSQNPPQNRNTLPPPPMDHFSSTVSNAVSHAPTHNSDQTVYNHVQNHQEQV